MKDYKKILEGIVNIINTTEEIDIGFDNICAYIDENCSELKESEVGRNKTMVDSKSEELSKGNGVLSGKNIRPLSSMTNIERQEWGLILADELEEDPYSWLVRHNFLEDKEIDIGLFKNLKGPNPPIYL